MFIVVCRLCQRRYSNNRTSSPRDLRPARCPHCGSTDFLVLGDIPGVTAPPLFPDTPPPTIPRVTVDRGVLRAVGLGRFAPFTVQELRQLIPPPVLALTNFPQTSPFVALFGPGTASELANTLGDRKELLFALSPDVCTALRPCLNPRVDLVTLVNALHPSGSPPVALTSDQIGEFVLWLVRGNGALTANGLIQLLEALATRNSGVFGNDIRDLVKLLVKAVTEPMTPTDLVDSVQALTSGAQGLTAAKGCELLSLLTKALTPQKLATVLRLFSAHGTGLAGTQIDKLIVEMCLKRQTSHVRKFFELTTCMLTANEPLTPIEYHDLTLQLRTECPAADVEWIYRTLNAQLSPKRIRRVCRDLIASGGIHDLSPLALLRTLRTLLDRQHPVTASDVMDLATWLLEANVKLTPQQFAALVNALLTDGTLAGENFFKFTRHLLTSVNESISAVEYHDLSVQLRIECKPVEVEWIYQKLGAELSPKRIRRVCRDLIDSGGIDDLPPLALLKTLQTLLNRTKPVTASQLLDMATWLLQGNGKLTPKQFAALAETLLADGTVTGEKCFNFTKHLLTSNGSVSATDFRSVVVRLSTVGKPLAPGKVIDTCSGVLRRGGTPAILLSFLNVFTTAAVFDAAEIYDLVSQFHKEELESAHMLSICSDLVIAGPDSLSILETGVCIRLLRNNRAGLLQQQVVTLVHAMCAAVGGGSLTPKQANTFLQHFLSGTPLTPTHALEYFNWTCTGANALTPTASYQLLELYLTQASALSASDFRSLVQTLQPTVNGLNPSQTCLLLSKMSPGTGATPSECRDLLLKLVNGNGALNSPQLFALIDSLFNTLAAPTGIRSKKTVELLERLLTGDTGKNNGITPTRAREVITALIVSFTRQDVHKLATTQAIVPAGNRKIPPKYLYDLCQVQGNHQFVPLAHAAHSGNHVSFQELLDIIGQADESNLPAVNLCTLLHYLPTVPANNRAYNIKKFLREAKVQGVTWTQIFVWLAGFVTADRAPFGTGYTPFAQNVTGTNTGGVNMAINVLYGGINFCVSDYRINYFCNSHTYRYFDFTRCERADRISLWAPATTWNGVVAMITNALNNGVLDDVLDDAVNHPGQYRATNQMGADTEAENGGVYYANTNTFYLRHFHSVGVGGVEIPKGVLKAIKPFFS